MQKKAWESVNPIGKNKITKWVKQNIPSQSLANLYPFEDTTVMDPEGFPIGTITDKEDLVLFDPLAERDTNHNILILGISGIGKTVLLWLLLQNEIIKGSFVRNIDIEGTCLKFTERLGGININMAGNNQYCINPLQIRIPDEIKAGLVDDYISEVKNFMSIYKSGWSERLLDLFEYYLTLVYRKKGITNETDLSKLKEDDFPLFEDIYKIIEEDKNNFDPDNTLATKTDLNELLLGMQSMVYGADAKLFNRYTYLGTNDMDTLQFMNFDLSDMSTSSKDRKLAQWSNVFTYISQFVNDNMDRKKKIVVSIDEAHDFLKKQYLPIVDIINDYERRFRKYLTSFIKASQTIDEFNTEDTELKDKVKPLFNQPGVKFLFHLGDIDYTIPKDLLNLKEAEINILKKKRKGKCLMRIEENVYDLDILMPAWFKEVKADAKSN